MNDSLKIDIIVGQQLIISWKAYYDASFFFERSIEREF